MNSGTPLLLVWLTLFKIGGLASNRTPDTSRVGRGINYHRQAAAISIHPDAIAGAPCSVYGSLIQDR